MWYVDPPDAKYKIGDKVTTTIRGKKVHGVIKKFTRRSNNGDVYAVDFESTDPSMPKIPTIECYESELELHKKEEPNPKELSQRYCWHTWVKYQGLNETFDYCEKCDKKKEK